jgi:hypothetical protein
MNHSTDSAVGMRSMKQVWPRAAPRPIMWLCSLRADDVQTVDEKTVRSFYCGPNDRQRLWEWFLYFCDRRKEKPKDAIYSEGEEVVNWRKDSFLLNVYAELNKLDQQGYFVILITCFKDGVGVFTTSQNLNWFLNLDRVGAYRISAPWT